MRRSSLFRKILLALLLIALLPLLVTSLILFLNLGAVRTNLEAFGARQRLVQLLHGLG